MAEKFWKMHNIMYKSIYGEASAVDRIAVGGWEKKCSCIIHKYDEQDIFNAIESGLFLRVLSNKIMAFKNETCSGEKVSKERRPCYCAVIW